MLHELPVHRLPPQGEAMADAIGSCVHCGFCLPTCPTYITLRREADSPRGRIVLMKEALEGGVELDATMPFLDNCLGCQACVSACPSGVEYGDLITAFRMYAEPRRVRSRLERLERAALGRVITNPTSLGLAARLGLLARPLRRVLPDRVRAMLDLLPQRLPPRRPLPPLHPATGKRRARVALLAGCAQQVLAPGIGWSTLRVLARNGVETVVPPTQGCCGALALHAGDAASAEPLARASLDSFPDDVDAIVTTAAGCGSGMRDYPLLLKGSSDEPRAAAFAGRVLDVSVFLTGLGLREPPSWSGEIRVAYHDACHLAHAQRVRSEPRALLRAIEGVTLLEADEWEVCCGSAGTYNVDRPATAAQLGERKAVNLLAAQPEAVATGNIGCIAQIGAHLGRKGSDIPVFHTVELLDRAYGRSGLEGR